MKSIMNYRNLRFTVHFKYLWLFFATMLSISLLSSCEKKDLEIQKGVPFEVSVMPIPKEIAKGQTIELRFTIKRTDQYVGTQYFIRYFQYDGLGQLGYKHKYTFLPNDLYPVPAEQFSLYYTSQSFVTQSFTIWISDNFGNEKQLSFQLNSINR